MYVCPNCTGNLKFDIPTQSLKCDSCQTIMDPYEFQASADAEAHEIVGEEYEITVYTCPQCGGELLSDDSTVATFCSFCGRSTILDSRLSKEKSPTYIIPFKKTREDCVKAYKQMMRRAFFAPKELQQEEQISRFRSIYMPYWVYTAEKDGPIAFDGRITKRIANHKQISFYRMRTRIHAKYRGLAFDAASEFSDNLSNAIAPYDWKEAKPFTPAFLSGFYADTSDVEPSIYEQDVKDIVKLELCNRLLEDPACARYELESDLQYSMEPQKVDSILAMFPVWFLAYRNEDRVNYVVVNGQTGKASGNLPVDKNRYLRGSVLLALPIFIFISLFRMNPSTMLVVAMALCALCCVVSVFQKMDLVAKEDYMDDKGSGRYLVIGKKESRTRLTQGVRFARQKQIKLRMEAGEFMRTIRKPVLGAFVAFLVWFGLPQAFFWHYVAIGFAMCMIGWNALDLITRYNRLTSRPLPQFRRRGGEVDGR